jgi:hypothetical protein
MSPEQVRGEKLDARTDLFSFGLVLYEMVTRQHAFTGDTALTLHDAILNHNPVPARELNPELPSQLEEIIKKALEEDREVRYQTALEIRSDLKRLSRDTTPGQVAAASAAAATTAGRSRRIWIFAVLILVLTLGGALTWLSRPLPPPRVINTKQITHDGISKQSALTDGSRLYITEMIASKQALVQASIANGDTSLIPTAFYNIGMFDISPEHSQLLVFDWADTAHEDQGWVISVPGGTRRRLGGSRRPPGCLVARWPTAGVCQRIHLLGWCRWLQRSQINHRLRCCQRDTLLPRWQSPSIYCLRLCAEQILLDMGG